MNIVIAVPPVDIEKEVNMLRFLIAKCKCIALCCFIIIVVFGIASYQRDSKMRIAALVSESKQKKAISENCLLQKNPLKDSDLTLALSFLNLNRDYASYHLLMAIRRFYPSVYKDIPNELKLSVLVSSLANTIYLNDWSILDPDTSFDRDSAVAILEIGEPAIIAMLPMLDDINEAKLFGSKDATLSYEYQYRRKDFAYRYISLLRLEVPVFDIEPIDRDKQIEMLKSKI